MEYQTAVKDYEQIVLEYGYNEIMRSQKEKGSHIDIVDQPKKLQGICSYTEIIKLVFINMRIAF